MPALECGQRLRDLAAVGPRLARPGVLLDDGDEVDQAPAADEVVHEVPAGTHPDLRRHLEPELAQPLGRNQPAIGDAAREARVLGRRTGSGARREWMPSAPTSTSKLGAGAVGEPRLDAIAVIAPDRSADGRDGCARRAARRPARRADRRGASGSAGKPNAASSGSASGARSSVRPSSQRRWCQASGRTPVLASCSASPSPCSTRDAFGLIWTPAPTSPSCRRLLVDVHVEAGAKQRQRRGQPADPATDDANGDHPLKPVLTHSGCPLPDDALLREIFHRARAGGARAGLQAVRKWPIDDGVEWVGPF